MNDVRELCLKPSSRSPSRWPFAIAAERPLKCNARSSATITPAKKTPAGAAAAFVLSAVLVSGRRDGDCVGSWKTGGTGSGRSSLQKLSRVFYCVVSPSFYRFSLRAAWREQIESSRMCKQQATHALSYVFHLRTTSFFITCLQSHRRLSQNSHASSRDSNSKVT